MSTALVARNEVGQFTGGKRKKKGGGKKKNWVKGGGGSGARQKYCAAAGHHTQRGGPNPDRPLGRCRRASKSAFRKKD